MNRRSCARLGLALLLVGCEPLPPQVARPSTAVAITSESAPPTQPAPALPSTPPAPAPAPPPLPPGVVPGELSRVAIPGYLPAYVIHGQAGVTRALVYLHGVCGSVHKIRDWARAASEQVTVIALLGDRACPHSGRFAWSQDIELIHQLIERALDATSAAREGVLNRDQVALFGYSQGASRAERLVARHPERYRWVILGGPPTAPQPENLKHAQRSAILVGTEEHGSLLRERASDLTAAGVPTLYDEFVGVGHGSFGPSSPLVMTRTLNWLFSSKLDGDKTQPAPSL